MQPLQEILTVRQCGDVQWGALREFLLEGCFALVKSGGNTQRIQRGAAKKLQRRLMQHIGTDQGSV